MRQSHVVINPTRSPAHLNLWMKIHQKFHTHKMLASDRTMYFVYPQNNRGNPFLVRQLFSDWTPTWRASTSHKYRCEPARNSKILYTREKKSFRDRDHVEKVILLLEDVNILSTDIATGDSLFKISFYKKSCDQFWPLTWNYVVIMFNSNRSQTLILITWSNKSTLGPKMGNPPPCQGIPYTTPWSIFVYKNSL